MPTKLVTRLLSLVMPTLAALAPSPSVSAQEVVQQVKEPPIFGGASLAIGTPQGEFAKHVDGSYGIEMHMGVRLTDLLGIRLDIAHLIYGSESWRAMDPSFPGVSFEMTTENTMTYFGLGPQLTWRLGPVRPFLNLSVGLSSLATSTELRGNNKDENLTEDTNFRDIAFAYGAGAGLAIPIPQWKGVTISVGAFYQSGGNAEYVLQGGLQNLGDGSVLPQTVESRTSVLRYHVGIGLGL